MCSVQTFWRWNFTVDVRSLFLKVLLIPSVPKKPSFFSTGRSFHRSVLKMGTIKRNLSTYIFGNRRQSRISKSEKTMVIFLFQGGSPGSSRWKPVSLSMRTHLPRWNSENNDFIGHFDSIYNMQVSIMFHNYFSITTWKCPFTPIFPWRAPKLTRIFKNISMVIETFRCDRLGENEE